MFNTLKTTHRNLVLKCGAVAAVLGSFGLLTLADHDPVVIDTDENSVLTVGLRLHQYAPVNQLPPWLALPDRSTAPYGNVVAGASNNRLFFSSLLPAVAVERHFRRLLLANGFQLAVMRPVVSGSGVSNVITAFDINTERSIQIVIRDKQVVRSVEVTYGGPALVAAKSLSIGS